MTQDILKRGLDFYVGVLLEIRSPEYRSHRLFLRVFNSDYFKVAFSAYFTYVTRVILPVILLHQVKNETSQMWHPQDKENSNSV